MLVLSRPILEKIVPLNPVVLLRERGQEMDRPA
jgi:hypothetical protein